MQLNIVIINIIMLVLSGFLHSQSVQDDELVTNLNIYSKILDKNLETLENQFVLLGNDKIYCIKANSKQEVSEYLYLKIRQRLNNFKIISDSDSASADFLVSFRNVNFKTKYNEIFGSLIKSQKVKRRIEVSYDYTVERKNRDSILSNKNINDFSEDEFYLERVEDVERGEYDFLKGVLPDQSFWEKAFIPGIVTLASAVAVVLFFIIRSK